NLLCSSLGARADGTTPLGSSGKDESRVLGWRLILTSQYPAHVDRFGCSLAWSVIVIVSNDPGSCLTASVLDRRSGPAATADWFYGAAVVRRFMAWIIVGRCDVRRAALCATARRR